MLKRVLIANRGEIGLRVLRACRELGVETVVVYSTADADQRYLLLADEAVCIGPPEPSKSYLNVANLLMAARNTGCDAVHPGYGFLAESWQFAEQVESSDLKFIGPRPESLKRLGDKIAAKRFMAANGIASIPGTEDEFGQHDDPGIISERFGYPVIIKAANGGGGRGMRVVLREEDLADEIVMARREAMSYFADERVYIEKYLLQPRHVEIQVIGDGEGNAIHLFERDCTVQRRHQKLIEEAPAPGIDREAILSLAAKCCEVCRGLKYRGLGTFEFLYQDDAFFFIEMNARIQVEHPVTEMVTGLDLVKMQLNVAAGEGISVRQEDVSLRGHAIECRVNAEDKNHVPSPGLIRSFRPPGGTGVRTDTHAYTGYVVSYFYDSLLAKVVALGENRGEASTKMAWALAELEIDGIETNASLLAEIVTSDEFVNCQLHVNFLNTA